MDGLKRGSEARWTNKIRDGQSLLEENWNSIEEGVTENREYLAAREKIFSSSVFQYFTDQKNRIIQESLETDNSFQILGAYTCLLDSIVQTAFDYSFIDIPLIKERLVEELNHELNYKQKNLPEKLNIRYFSKFQIVLIDTFSVKVLSRINLKIFKIKNFTFCSFKS